MSGICRRACVAKVTDGRQGGGGCLGGGAPVEADDDPFRTRWSPMRLSRYFLPVTKETPADAQIVSHKLMLRAGLIRQTAAGIYAWLPLGLKVLKHIEAIVREEPERAGAIELLMRTFPAAALLRQSGRYATHAPQELRAHG